MDTASQASPKRSFSIRRVALLVLILGSICAIAIKLWADRIVEQAERHKEQTMLHWFEFTTSTPQA